MILELTGGRILHTAYSDNNLNDPEGFSLTDQTGATYKGTYIDNSQTESTNPADYEWEELFNPDIDDTGPDGEYGTLTNEAELSALQSQINALQDRAQLLAEQMSENSSSAAAAANLAGAADKVANATNQHFWTDTSGAHVTEVPQEEWNDPDSPNYQSGSNSLFNALGLLFRKGLNYLTTILAGDTPETRGMVLYDGQANNDTNIIAAFLGSTMFYQTNGIKAFEVEAGELNQEINEPHYEVNFSTFSVMPDRTENGFYEYDLPIKLANEADSVSNIEVGYSWDIIYPYADGNGNANLTPAAPSEDIYNGAQQIAALEYVFDGTDTITLTVKALQSLVDDGQNGMSFLIWPVTVEYITAGIAASRIYAGAYPNKSDNFLFTVGNGKDENNPSNAMTVDWDGNIRAGGDLFSSVGIHKGTQNEHYKTLLQIGNFVIISGNVEINVAAANTNYEAYVKYSKPFKYNPNVQLTLLNIGGSYYLRPSVYGPGTQGFAVRLRAGGAAGSVKVNWVAFGELA